MRINHPDVVDRRRDKPRFSDIPKQQAPTRRHPAGAATHPRVKPAMTQKQIELLEGTLHELRRDPVLAAQLFYCQLFARRPAMRRLLGGRPDIDGSRLFAVISTALAGLSHPQHFVGLLNLFARPAVHETLRAGAYAGVIGEALDWMLKEHPHVRWTVEVRDAWRAAYERVLATVGGGMMLAAH
jgi:hemoglobin-like flavoprotein